MVFYSESLECSATTVNAFGRWKETSMKLMSWMTLLVGCVLVCGSGCSLAQPDPAWHSGFHTDFSLARIQADKRADRLVARFDDWIGNWTTPQEWQVEYPHSQFPEWGMNSQEARWWAVVPVAKATSSLRFLHSRGVRMTEGWLIIAAMQSKYWDDSQVWACAYKQQAQRLLEKSDVAAEAIRSAEAVDGNWLEKARRVDEAIKKVAAFYYVIGQASKYEASEAGAFRETIGDFPERVYLHLNSYEVSFEEAVKSYLLTE